MSVDQEKNPETKPSAPLDFLRRAAARLPSPPALFFMALMAWILSGVFFVGPDEVGVVKLFGRKDRVEDPGVHYHLPWPIGAVIKPKVGRVHRLEFGFRSGKDPDSADRPIRDEALMPTKNVDMVDLRFTVQYKIDDAEEYVFRLADPEKVIRSAAEAAVREVVGRTPLDQVLAEGKEQIAKEATERLRAALKNYGIGLKILGVRLQAVHPPRQVRAAFKGVVSAREEMNRIINEARALENELIPEAKGRAATVLARAEAYREEKVRRAEGEAARFLALLEEYRRSAEVTRRRLYLETMEDVLSQTGRIVLEPSDRNILPLLEMPDLRRSAPEAETVEGQGRGRHE